MSTHQSETPVFSKFMQILGDSVFPPGTRDMSLKICVGKTVAR